MNTSDLKAFTVIYESKSFSQAAKRLYTSPQGAAKIINRLEDEIKVPLFIRSRSGITPTEYGRALYFKADDIQLIFSDIASIRSNVHRQKTLLSVFSTYGYLEHLGSAYFEEFQRQNPDILINMIDLPDSLLPSAFQRQRTHIGFMIGPVDDNRYQSFFMETNHYGVLLPENYPLKHADGITLEELARIPLAIKGKEYQIYALHLNIFIKNGLYPNVELEAANDSFLFEFVLSGRGGAVILDYQPELQQYAHYVRQGHLRLFPILDADFLREIYFVWPKAASLSSAELRFRQYVLDHRSTG